MKQRYERKPFSTIRWKAVSKPPEEGSYVLIQCLDEDGAVVCKPAAYEKGAFLYVYDRNTWGEIREEIILGWAYYPFDLRG